MVLHKPHKSDIPHITNIIKYYSTIFKTFQSDLDGISNKLGFSKRSFAEWGKQVSTSFKESEGIVNSFKNALKTAFIIPTEKDSSWIKNSFGEIITKDNIDSFIPELDSNRVEEIITEINAVNKIKGSWNDYYKTLHDGEDFVVDLIKNTDDLSKLTGEDLVKANQSARQAVIAHNQALQQQTLGAKAATITTKALAVALNIGLSIGISKVIEGIQYLASSTERYLESQQEIVDKTKEQIAEYDTEINSLTALQEKLEDAKGNKEKLAQIQNELNNAIGETPGLLNNEDSAWSVANQKITDRIALLKKLREEELQKNIQATKNIYNNQEVDNDWGSDKQLSEYFDYSNEEIRNAHKDGRTLKSFNTLKNEYLQQADSNGKSFAEFIADYMENEMEEGVFAHLPNAEEIQVYLDKQYSTIAPLFSEYISNLDTSLPKEALENILKELVYINPNDAEAVENQFKAFINALKNSGLEKAYND